ncbi:MAG: MBL fold metallo-hydrolase [Alphaproteobacteria bacterium]|nr:MBL fold metallo-hydrolase [Alphaproteobacteria bacterium]
MRIQFLGAAGTVTGSRTLVTCGDTRVLVDCGMFQGFKQNRLRNWDPLEVNEIDAVVLTHAHVDHSGWIPALVRNGYQGPVYCTKPTADLLSILLPDAGRIQEEDAEYANRKGHTKHAPALPIYTEQDAYEALKRIVPVELHAPYAIGGVEVEHRVAGHILGATSVVVRNGERVLQLSGDLGRPDDAVVPAPEPPAEADVLVLESTYGNRLHPDVDKLERLATIVTQTVERGGMVLIPSFAVGRAQGLLWGLHRLMEEGRIPRLPIVVDSPMATKATDAFVRNPDALRLTPGDLRAMTRNVQFVGSVEESRGVNSRTEPFVLIAASGMLTGGRVLHHLVQRAPTKKNTLLFVGFQAPGTRGGRIVAGERTVKMFGNKIKLRCDVEEIGGFSAHGDQQDLLAWVRSAPMRPGRIFLNHGEPEASDALRGLLKDEGYDVTVASEGVEWDLSEDRRTVLKPVPPKRAAKRPAAPEPQGLAGASLEFREDGDAVVDAIRAALRAMESGALPRIPVVAHGERLAARLEAALAPEELRHVQIERT